jgi:polar amino acid transport system substrate-binding protein
MKNLHATADLINLFAPTGQLRASINMGNPILANRKPQTGEPFGISVDLANSFADLLKVEIELIVLDTAKASVEAVRAEQADIGFFAIDPDRSDGIFFTAPYVLIEGCYMVKNESPIHSNEDVDRDGVQVTVGQGSAYDLYLTRALKQAQIVRAPSSPTVTNVFVENKLDVAAGVKQQLEADQKRFPGHRLLPGRFMVIQQAMGTFASKGSVAADFLSTFVEHQKSSGFVSHLIEKHNIQGASVAPNA